MVDVDAQHALEVAAIQDQQPVETLGADGADEPLGVGVCLWCADRRVDHLDALAAEDLVEGGGESHEGGPPRRADFARRDKARAEEACSCCTLDWISAADVSISTCCCLTGVVLSGVRFLRMSMVSHRWCSDWTMQTNRCVRRSSR